jgi:polyisoprenyl-phosphate glycosyltransferase
MLLQCCRHGILGAIPCGWILGPDDPLAAHFCRQRESGDEDAISMAKPLLTILCPVYNEEAVVPLFLARIAPVMTRLSERYTVHLLFLDNASTDGTAQRLQAVKAAWPATYVITMSRNVGYQASIDCGLRHAQGDLFVIIDVDCEDPPEMILDFVARCEEGYDIVYGERIGRPEPGLLVAARKFFYRLLHSVADDDIILDMAEFSLFTKDVRDAFLRENTSFPFIRSAIGRVGFSRWGIPFTRQPRIAGKSHYSLVRMSVFALAGILSSSTLLLRLPIYVLPFWLGALGVLGALFIATQSPWYVLWAALVFASYVGATVAFIALYVARTYRNGLQRPNAFINHRKSVLQPSSDPR